MATSESWRTRLNERNFSKKIRENNAKESTSKSNAESKGLIAANDNDLLVWDNASSNFQYFNLQNLNEQSQEKNNRSQILLCTDNPKFDVEWLVWNISQTHLALWGQLGITVLELPQKWGKFAEFQGGKDSVSCKCVSLAEHYFSSHAGVKLLQVAWHPASSTDSHIVFLTSDNLISIYDLLEPDRPTQTIYLGENEPSYTISRTWPSTSSALGDNVVAFDFGASVELERKSMVARSGKGSAVTVCPLYCVRGNGDVVVAFTDLSTRPVKLPIQGPLLMYPPAEDNYGTDACAILCIATTPPVVVIATCDGRLYHCVLFAKDIQDTALQSESSYSVPEDCSMYETPDEKLLYVNETVELELSLTMPTIEGEPVSDIFTCPVRLVKGQRKLNCNPKVKGIFKLVKTFLNNVIAPDRYHCCHAAGVHTVALPWLHNFINFCLGDEDEDTLPIEQQSIVEHLICTKPLQTSPPSPVLGLAQVKDTSIGSILLTLTSEYEFQCLRLSDTRYSAETSMLSSSQFTSIPSPLRKISKEPFDERIRKILQKNVSNPLIKSRSNTEQSQQECYQLLSRNTQVFREEYIAKLDLARQEIKRRVSVLREQKNQQFSDLAHLQESRDVLTEGAERLAIQCEDCKDKQVELIDRLQNVMRKLQARTPFLSEAERSMKRELENIEERLDKYQQGLEQIKKKYDYQQRQIQQSKKTNQPSPVFKKNQMSQIRAVLQQDGKEVADLMQKLNQLKVDANV